MYEYFFFLNKLMTQRHFSLIFRFNAMHLFGFGSPPLGRTSSRRLKLLNYFSCKYMHVHVYAGRSLFFFPDISQIVKTNRHLPFLNDIFSCIRPILKRL